MILSFVIVFTYLSCSFVILSSGITLTLISNREGFYVSAIVYLSTAVH